MEIALTIVAVWFLVCVAVHMGMMIFNDAYKRDWDTLAIGMHWAAVLPAYVICFLLCPFVAWTIIKDGLK